MALRMWSVAAFQDTDAPIQRTFVVTNIGNLRNGDALAFACFPSGVSRR